MRVKVFKENQFRKIGEYEYEVNTSVEYNKEVRDYIEHNGKTYTSISYVDVKTTTENLYRENPEYRSCFEYYIDCFNTTIKIWDYTGWAMRDSVLYQSYSTNDYVNRFRHFIHQNKSDFPFIKGVWNGKNPMTSYRKEFKDILKYQRVWIPISEYGWNCKLFVGVSLKDLIMNPNRNESHYVNKIFKENGYDLEKIWTRKDYLRLIQNSIYETSK